LDAIQSTISPPLFLPSARPFHPVGHQSAVRTANFRAAGPQKAAGGELLLCRTATQCELLDGNMSMDRFKDTEMRFKIQILSSLNYIILDI
jgi:hypothetical protein